MNDVRLYGRAQDRQPSTVNGVRWFANQLPAYNRRAGRLVGLAMSASRSCPSSTPSGDDCGRTMHRICKRVPCCESPWVPVAHRLKRCKILGADFLSDHLHDSSSDVLSRTGSLSLPNAIATQRGIARTQAQRWTCSAAHELQVHRSRITVWSSEVSLGRDGTAAAADWNP